MPKTRLTLPTQREPQPLPDLPQHAGTRASCPACGSERLTSLGMVLTDGTPVRFTSCRNCECRAWADEGGALPLADVLSRTRKQLQD
jgi:formate dehydrogenase maturation protein FdhE